MNREQSACDEILRWLAEKPFHIREMKLSSEIFHNLKFLCERNLRSDYIDNKDQEFSLYGIKFVIDMDDYNRRLENEKQKYSRTKPVVHRDKWEMI